MLRPTGTLSITEASGDPDRLSVDVVRDLAKRAGFELVETFRGRLHYTANFRRSA